MHASTPGDYYLDWMTTAAAANNTSRFGGLPDAVNFTIGDSGYVNSSGGTYIAYCWAPKKGYSSFGTYTGNGVPDGPLVYTGFRPAYLMIKSSQGTTMDWKIIDNKRSPFNVASISLRANGTHADTTCLLYTSDAADE